MSSSSESFESLQSFVPSKAPSSDQAVTKATDPADSGRTALPAAGSLPLALTVTEAAEMLRLDPRTVRAMLRAGELEGNQRNHAIRISRSSVLDWLCGKRRVSRSRR